MGWSNRRTSGSKLVLVLAAIVIAATIAVSYLIFADNLRERAARTLEQDQREITTEQGILEIEEQVRIQLIRPGFADLGTVDPNQPLSFDKALVGHSYRTTLSFAPILPFDDTSNLTSPFHPNPFPAPLLLI